MVLGPVGLNPSMKNRGVVPDPSIKGREVVVPRTRGPILACGVGGLVPASIPAWRGDTRLSTQGREGAVPVPRA